MALVTEKYHTQYKRQEQKTELPWVKVAGEHMEHGEPEDKEMETHTIIFGVEVFKTFKGNAGKQGASKEWGFPHSSKKSIGWRLYS